jgi:hypothetical protein
MRRAGGVVESGLALGPHRFLDMQPLRMIEAVVCLYACWILVALRSRKEPFRLALVGVEAGLKGCGGRGICAAFPTQEGVHTTRTYSDVDDIDKKFMNLISLFGLDLFAPATAPAKASSLPLLLPLHFEAQPCHSPPLPLVPSDTKVFTSPQLSILITLLLSFHFIHSLHCLPTHALDCGIDSSSDIHW